MSSPFKKKAEKKKSVTFSEVDIDHPLVEYSPFRREQLDDMVREMRESVSEDKEENLRKSKRF